MDIVFARNRWFLVSVVPRWYELYSSDFLFPSNAGTLKRCPVSGFGRRPVQLETSPTPTETPEVLPSPVRYWAT
jgi:hypothetical protein